MDTEGRADVERPVLNTRDQPVLGLGQGGPASQRVFAPPANIVSLQAPLAHIAHSFPTSRLPAVNVAQVPQRSPLRYPGGKTWLIPHVRDWLRQVQPTLLVEPFCGGGIVSLTAVMEGLVEQCVMLDLDPDVAAFWHAVLREGEALAQRIETFEPTRERVEALSQKVPLSVLDHGFRTLVLNRTRRSGILAPGAALIRQGENGQGLGSRWYPDTLARRIRAIQPYASRIAFAQGDALALLPPLLHGWGRRAALFVDPPYTAGGKRAGQRLYAHHELDHEQLFALLACGRGSFLLTYDAAPAIEHLVLRYGFHPVRVAMKNAHHARLPELVITPEPLFT